MINRKNHILKRKYISPMLVVEETEPWELMAGSQTDVNGDVMPGGGNTDPFGGSAKSNSFFEQYPDIFEDTTEE